LNYNHLSKMYSRNARAALRRGQSIPDDIVRVTEGIAASIRQFSISASRHVDEQSQYYLFAFMKYILTPLKLLLRLLREVSAPRRQPKKFPPCRPPRTPHREGSTPVPWQPNLLVKDSPFAASMNEATTAQPVHLSIDHKVFLVSPIHLVKDQSVVVERQEDGEEVEGVVEEV